MPDYHVYINAYDDRRQCQQAIASVPDGIPVHVFDGRHANFPGDHDTTPGLAEDCEDYPDVTYHEPAADRLPFGSMDDPAEYRTPNHEKSNWVIPRLPQDEWVVKLDTDERLHTMDVDLDALDPRGKYCPVIEFPENDRSVHIARLYQPQYWTPWIGDCLLPRELFPRDTPIECLHAAYTKDVYAAVRFAYRTPLQDIEIMNHGPSRPDEYQQRRLEQLRHLGREDRFMELKRDVLEGDE